MKKRTNKPKLVELRIHKVLSTVLTVLGFTIIIGTAGTVDTGDISVTQTVLQLLSGLACFAVAVWYEYVTYEKEDEE